MNCEKLYQSDIFKSIEKVKSNKKLDVADIKTLDNFFSDSSNHMFLNTILSNSVNFDYGLLKKTILSTFKNNFTCFKNICKKGVHPTIYAGYKSIDIINQSNYININGELKPFIWINKQDIKMIINNSSNIEFDLNLYYFMDGLVNLNELKKLKSHSNLILVGKNKYPYIDFKNFSNSIIEEEDFEKKFK